MEHEDNTLFSISDKPEKVANSHHHVPSYNVAHVYNIDEEDSDDKPKQQKLSRNSCWNCGNSGHSLRDCPEPLDPYTINKNRALFTSRKPFNEFKRYHVDLKENRYPHLKPGVISDKLREALGLNEDQLPMHIYRMRTLGYPPGWLLEAKFDSSGIEMFDMDGNRVPNADEEEGEIGGTVIDYDESKIISYPGFNEWPAPGILDETKHYGVPELKSLQSREDFIKSLKEINALTAEHRQRMKAANPQPDILAGECDMETEDIDEDIKMTPVDGMSAFIPPLPAESETPPPPPPEDGEIQSLKEEGNSCETQGTTSQDSFASEENPLCDLDDSTHGKIVSIELGTPVLKIHSPYNKLPPPEAFQKDISDVINFENLPDSIGTYEKLKDVLKSVRQRMSLLKETKLNATI